MKNKFLAILCLTFLLFVITYAEEGESWHGPTNNIKHTWHTGYDFRGDYIVSEAKGYGSKKQVYARMGSEGNYSDWVDEKTEFISTYDYGGFGSIGSKNYAHAFVILNNNTINYEKNIFSFNYYIYNF